MSAEPLAQAVPEADGGYRDHISAPREGSGIAPGSEFRVPQGRQLGQALGAYSVPGSVPLTHEERAYNVEYARAGRWPRPECDIILRYEATLREVVERMARRSAALNERAVRAEGECRALRAALSEALEAVR